MKQLIFSLLCSIFTLSATASEIAVVSLAAGDHYREVVDLGIKSKETYCARHGYDFICGSESLDTSRHPAWSKILIILDAMEDESRKWIFWTDADALIMNQAIKLENFVDDNYNFIITCDWGGVNTGHFLIKNCEWSRQFLLASYAHTEFLTSCYYEQEAVKAEMFRPENGKYIKYINQRLMNSYANEVHSWSLLHIFQPGDFILHFASVHGSDWLQSLFVKYYGLIEETTDLLSLNHYLGIYSITPPAEGKIVEGWVTATQKDEMINSLHRVQGIKKVTSIGLSDGSLADIVLQNTSGLKNFSAFDKDQSRHTQASIDYFKAKYGDRFTSTAIDFNTSPVVLGDQLPIAQDLIIIDGRREEDVVYRSILNGKIISQPSTLVWVNNCQIPMVANAVQKAYADGLIDIKEIHQSDDVNGTRKWIEFSYNN